MAFVPWKRTASGTSGMWTCKPLNIRLGGLDPFFDSFVQSSWKNNSTAPNRYRYIMICIYYIYIYLHPNKNHVNSEREWHLLVQISTAKRVQFLPSTLWGQRSAANGASLLMACTLGIPGLGLLRDDDTSCLWAQHGWSRRSTVEIIWNYGFWNQS